MSPNVPDVPAEILPFLKQRPGLSIFGTKPAKPPPQPQSIHYRCNLCPFETNVQQHYQNHVMEHKSKDFPCPICNKIYKSEIRLQMHLQTHESSISLPHTCMYCEKRFKSQSLLHSHTMRMHFPVQVSCPACNKHFSSKATLKKHIQNVHETYPK